MIKDYAIACLLTEESIKELSQAIPFLEKNNIPHISLFQFASGDAQFILDFKKYLCGLTIPSEVMPTTITKVEDNIFLNLVHDNKMIAAAENLAEFYAEHCKIKQMLSQIKLDELTLEQSKLVHQYGIYWVKEHFTPHVTLLYNKSIYLDSGIGFPKKIYLCAPALYSIDNVGRVLK